MTPAFLSALAKTLGYEGGFVCHPADPGGCTNWGITQRTYDAYRKTVGKSPQSVELMDDDEMRTIYHDDYWQAVSGDLLPERLAAAVFDMAVHSGPWNARLTLQRSLGVRADGVIGPVTLAAAKNGSVLAFLKKRAGFIQDLISARPSQVVFLEGWINRLLEEAWNP